MSRPRSWLPWWQRPFYAPLDHVHAAWLEAGRRHRVHLFGSTQVQPEAGEAFDVFRHRCLDVQTGKLVEGLRLSEPSAKGLQAEAFDARAVAQWQAEHGALSRDDTPFAAPRLLVLQAGRSDTERQTDLPDTALLCEQRQGIARSRLAWREQGRQGPWLEVMASTERFVRLPGPDGTLIVVARNPGHVWLLDRQTGHWLGGRPV